MSSAFDRLTQHVYCTVLPDLVMIQKVSEATPITWLSALYFCRVPDIGKKSSVPKDGVNLSLPRNLSLRMQVAPGHA